MNDGSTLVTKTTDTQQALVIREDALEAARRYLKQSKADATWRAYKNDWRLFETWCAAAKLETLPAVPATVVLFIAAQADLRRSPSTIQRRLAAIRAVHLGSKLDSPHAAIEVIETLSGIRRAWGKPKVQKRPAVVDDLKTLVDECDIETLQGLRDRALLLVGFAGAFRRSELVALTIADIVPHEHGLELNIRSSKTDQEGIGETVALRREDDSYYCPVESLEQWLNAAGITEGALFRQMNRGDTVRVNALSSQSVALIIKKYAKRVGLDATKLAGHSLRSGFLTSAARNKASVFKMAEVSRHKSLQTLRDYVRDAEKFEDHAGEGLLAG